MSDFDFYEIWVPYSRDVRDQCTIIGFSGDVVVTCRVVVLL